MRRLIYQVAVGPQSNLYEHCIQSAAEYAKRIGADHIVQRQPKLRIVPDVFRTDREGKCGGWKKLGYLPIFEKENAFELMDEYDQILILDADIYIRPTASNIFEDLPSEYGFGGVCECDMPISAEHAVKIKQYSHMQYQQVAGRIKGWRYSDWGGLEFFNMGMMVLNSAVIKPFLRGQSPREFLMRPEFQDMLDGVGTYKWSTDQTLLNYWLKKDRIPVKHLDWKYNGLYGSLWGDNINACDFVHFYLKDKLPENGENVDSLMEKINV
jgi:alpha-N-acetylglucosamine transferase